MAAADHRPATEHVLHLLPHGPLARSLQPQHSEVGQEDREQNNDPFWAQWMHHHWPRKLDHRLKDCS